MTYKGDPIAEKLDKMAEAVAGAVGLTRLQRRLNSDVPPRFRILPLVLLTLAVAGLAIQIAWPGGPIVWPNGPGFWGFWVIMMAWFGTTVFFTYGPLSHRRKGKWDEREAAVFRQGHFVGMMWALGAAVLGSLAIAFGKMGAILHLWTLWAPESPFDWMAITFFLVTLELNVAVLAASAATPEPLDDEEE